MKYKYILEIELNEENEVAKEQFDCAMGEGACLREFVQEIENEICDLLPYGIRAEIKKF